MPVDGSTYEQGIIYWDGQNKGDTLKSFLDQCEKLPRHIVMLDDKLGHLTHVQEVIEPIGIHFTGFRYGFLDDEVKQFDMQRSHI